MKHARINAVLLVLCFIFGIGQAFSQASGQTQRPGEDFNNCEYLGLVLDHALTEQAKNPDSLVIVVARMGKGEVKNNLNQSRLKYVTKYLELKGASGKFVCAEAERINEKGGLEIYVNGKLFAKVSIGKNAKRYCIGIIG